MHWSTKIDRPMPWKNEKNPYYIWLSEIILQQTRVEQGLPYYVKFVNAYPTVRDLAHANEDEVLKLWEGLGYYSRARNLLKAARYIVETLQAKFPTTYAEIRNLIGTGEYTAAAVASFAYNLPYAVVDGNVYRVLSRVFAIEIPTDSTAGKKYFAKLAADALDQEKPGIYNQAIMDFGAIQCVPKNPDCLNCDLQSICMAFQQSKVEALPVKLKKIIKRTRYLQYLVFLADGETMIVKGQKDVWKGLHQFPFVETNEASDLSEMLKHVRGRYNQLDFKLTFAGNFKQLLTHQEILATFWQLEVDKLPAITEGKIVSLKNINDYAYPKIIKMFLSSRIEN